jgi:hypothetical protein
MNRKYFQEFCLLRCNTVHFLERQPTFRNDISSLTSGPKNKQQDTCMKHVKEATYSTETSAEVQWTTLCYISEDRTFHKRILREIFHLTQNLETTGIKSEMFVTEVVARLQCEGPRTRNTGIPDS